MNRRYAAELIEHIRVKSVHASPYPHLYTPLLLSIFPGPPYPPHLPRPLPGDCQPFQRRRCSGTALGGYWCKLRAANSTRPFARPWAKSARTCRPRFGPRATSRPPKSTSARTGERVRRRARSCRRDRRAAPLVAKCLISGLLFFHCVFSKPWKLLLAGLFCPCSRGCPPPPPIPPLGGAVSATWSARTAPGTRPSRGRSTSPKSAAST
jgi:hypothetical protein